jgi:hypothetical protein
MKKQSFAAIDCLLSSLHIPLAMAIVAFGLIITGCATAPPPSVGTTGLPNPGVGVTPAAAPMTLPRFLGVDSVTRSVHRVVYRSRLRVANYLPILEPLPPSAAPVAVGDPCCLESPSPAVATAAAIQQAEAATPAKVNALGFLSTLDMCRNPQVEEAFLAAMDDPSENVRLAAIQGVINATENCGASCNSCQGCCTPAIQQRLQRMAYDLDEKGCVCEPSPKVRRLARIAACRCQPTEVIAVPSTPEELPAPEVLKLSQQP